MTRLVSFYHKDTGLLDGQHLTASSDQMVEINTPPDHIAIAGHCDHRTRRVNVASGELIGYSAPENAVEAKMRTLAGIRALEATQPRALREAALGDAGAIVRLKAIDDQITALRSTL
jgi:hypothetical protein